MLAKSQNIAFPRRPAFAVAASANLPTIPFAVLEGLSTLAAHWVHLDGLISAIGLIIFSPVVSGKAPGSRRPEPSMITDPSVDFHWFALDNPGLISILLAFFSAGSVRSRARSTTRAEYAEMEVRCPHRPRRRRGPEH